MKDAKHYFIHLLASPHSARFILLHRWIGPQGTGTRMFTASLDGTDVRLIDANGFKSGATELKADDPALKTITISGAH